MADFVRPNARTVECLNRFLGAAARELQQRTLLRTAFEQAHPNVGRHQTVKLHLPDSAGNRIRLDRQRLGVTASAAYSSRSESVSMPPTMAHSCIQLGSQDLARFRELMAVFADAFGDTHAYRDAPPSGAYLQGLLAKSTVIALAAEVEGVVVGGLVAYVLEKFERERSEIYIYDLAVTASHRRQGIARDLILLLKRIAKDKRAYVIYVQADLVDDPAIQLYTSLGTREDVLHFDIDVD